LDKFRPTSFEYDPRLKRSQPDKSQRYPADRQVVLKQARNARHRFLCLFFSVPETPKSIVYLRPDTIGDLIIFTSALAELQAAWPNARHTLVVRSGYETLAPLFPTSLGWHVARLNPFKQKPSACRAELTTLLDEIEALRPDLIVAPTLNRTWLEAAVAAHFPKIRSVVLGTQDVDPIFAAALRLELGVEVATAFTQKVPADAKTTDWENQHRLVDHLLAKSEGGALPAAGQYFPAFLFATPVFGVVRGGRKINQIPDECIIEVDIRIPVGMTLQ
jgi:hypothetical protein